MDDFVRSLINSGPVGLLAAGELLAIIGLVVWLKSVYKILYDIQERRVIERDAVVTALKSSADGLEDVASLSPQIIEALRVLNEIKEMILPEAHPRKRR